MSQTKTTIRDVAQRAGVSAGTVSNVLNRPFYVNADTRQRVLEAIRELNFVPQQRARQFRPGRVRSLGVAVANLGNPFFVDVALGAEEAARSRGVGVVISNSADDAERENQNLELLTQQRVQGLIISPVDELSSRLQMMHDRGVPMVFVDRVGEEYQHAWSVVVDDVAGGRLAAEHVLERGYRRLGFAGDPEISPKVRRRLRGVKEVLAGHDDVVLEVISTGTWTVESGREAAEHVVDMPAEERPAALLCANDHMALGVLQSLSRAGLRVPEDIAVVGYDDLQWAAAANPPLTTVRQPRYELGATAVEMLLELFDRNGAENGAPPAGSPKHAVLTPELVARDTT
ncbi:LacI family DNA-binding transcriptional regulator [Nesterenkonia alba]|uniref:LacI family DNA-binding transcriptional regulator n=1 Tax=Nesterenkonia alba TaxID=515814 RepID=UPI0003B6E3E4|nr:LacI family DNA-binding transcriptional regulator [Nesterenkonia alba]